MWGKNQLRRHKPIKAPMGSVIPVQKEYQIAFLFFPVAWYIGNATAIPSGILCKAIAIATEIPMVISCDETKKVPKPSGKLWTAIAIAVKSPARLIRWVLLCFFYEKF